VIETGGRLSSTKRVPSSGGAVRCGSLHRVGSNVAARRFRRRAESRTTRFLALISIQRSRRVTVGGNVDDSSRWVESLCGANRVAFPWVLRFGAGSSEPEPTSPLVRAGTCVGVATFAQAGAESRGKPWQPVASKAR
jgi:hypothetical protein